MLKIQKRLVFLALLIFFGFIIFSNQAIAEASCPFDKINDPAPGQCNLYVDENGNDICDLSETNELTPNNTRDGRVKSVQTQQGLRVGSALISMWSIFLPSVGYFLHWYLVRWFKDKSPRRCKNSLLRGVISEPGMRYVWNLVLLILFIPGGLFGLVIGLGYKTPFLVYWHYQGGAAMVIITFIHLLNHLTYYLKGWKTLKI